MIRPHFRHQRSRVWVWLGWLVPGVSFWFPHQVVRDIHRGSSPGLDEPAELELWWLLWVGHLIVGRLTDRIALSEELEYVSWLGPFHAVSTLLMVGALVCWVRIVTAVVRLQEASVPFAA